MEVTVKTHEFSIVASGLNPADDDFESRFYDAGCDDATISFQKGHIIVDFAREASSFEDAIASAYKAVCSAGAKVKRIEPDPLVSLAEIATRTGLSRAALTQYSKGQRGKDFPSPTVKVTSDSPLWDWAEVAKWMCQHRKISREAAVEAEVVGQANSLIACGAQEITESLHQRMVEFEECL